MAFRFDINNSVIVELELRRIWRAVINQRHQYQTAATEGVLLATKSHQSGTRLPGPNSFSFQTSGKKTEIELDNAMKVLIIPNLC